MPRGHHTSQTVGPCCLVALKQSEGGCAAIIPGGAAAPPYPMCRIPLGMGISSRARVASIRVWRDSPVIAETSPVPFLSRSGAAQTQPGGRCDRFLRSRTGRDRALKSMGIPCALGHSTVDDSFAPGIGRRLDGWLNRGLNAGAIINLAPDVSPFTAALQVDEATVRTVLNSGGLAQNLRRATASGRPETPHSISLIIPAGSPRLAS